MNNAIIELFSIPTTHENVDWDNIVHNQSCPYIGKTCDKNRKSEPAIMIGTCSVKHGKSVAQNIIICPHRFLERGQVFIDCLHLLTLHEPGNELHKVPEVQIPGGSLDYVLVSVRDERVVDFVGIEFQALDTTGSVWPHRQALLAEKGVIDPQKVPPLSPFGMNWKMTAKTILMQLHHKIETFEGINKHLVLVIQDEFLDYIRKEFQFDHVQDAKLGDFMHFHSYSFSENQQQAYKLQLSKRLSTNRDGVASILKMKAGANVELDIILNSLQSKISARTLLRI